jgi:hypothetical protein
MEILPLPQRRSRNALLLCLLLGFGAGLAAGCGASDTKSAPAVGCPARSDFQERDGNRPHFVTRKLTGAATEGAAFLYQLNSSNGSVRAILNRGSDATDALVFRDSRNRQLVWLERLMGRMSRLTRITCAQSGQSGKSREFGSLPENTFGMGYLDSGMLLALGWNDGKVSVFSEDFKQTVVENKTPAHVEALSSLRNNDSHFNSFLSRAGSMYILSTGYDLAGFKPTQAKFLKLDHSAIPTEIKTEIKLAKAIDIPECNNAYQEYTLQVSGSEIFMGCNPQFNGNNGLPVRLVYSSIDAAGVMVSRTLGANPDNDAAMVLPSGIKVGGGWVFVTEQKVTDSSRMTVSPGRYLRSYWLDLKNGEKKPMPGIGGNVVFDETERNYVFSCVVPKDSSDGECSQNEFAVLAESQWDRPDLAKNIRVTYDYDFVQFERPIF